MEDFAVGNDGAMGAAVNRDDFGFRLEGVGKWRWEWAEEAICRCSLLS